MGDKQHHHKKANNDGIKWNNIDKTFKAIFYGIAVIIKKPSPDKTHENG